LTKLLTKDIQMDFALDRCTHVLPPVSLLRPPSSYVKFCLVVVVPVVYIGETCPISRRRGLRLRLHPSHMASDKPIGPSDSLLSTCARQPGAPLCLTENRRRV